MGRSAQRVAPTLSPAWRAIGNARRRVARLADALERAYGTPDLGNLADPLDEAIYIVLTYQTDLDRARQVWAALRSRFPSWDAVLLAGDDEVSDVLRPSGLQRVRARMIRQLLQGVVARWGVLSLQGLRAMPTEEAEAELRAIPGLDIKGARCVLMYALDRAVFPVDSNAFRFLRRFGIVRQRVPYRRRTTHDEVQGLIAPADRRRLHVNLVVHGQTTCLPRTPRCGACPVRRACAYGRDKGRVA
jgi:endonuclease III